MGLIYTDITLVNPRKADLKPLDVKCLVDTGSMWMCIPEHVSIQLGLEELEKREVTTADGKKHTYGRYGFDNSSIKEKTYC